jgi:hypothetical protein
MTVAGIRRVLAASAVALAIGLASALDVPHTFTSGEVISAAEMNENFAAVGAAIAGMSARLAPDPLPALMLRRSGQGTVNLAITPVVFSDVVLDTDELFDPTAPTQVRSGAAGLYLISVRAFWEANATGVRVLQVNQGGSAVLFDRSDAQSAGVTPLATSGLLIMDELEPLIVTVFQNSGGALDVTTAVDLVWIGHLP